jgi:hypothetical protein
MSVMKLVRNLQSKESDYNNNICNGFVSIKDDRRNILTLAGLLYSDRSQYQRNTTYSWWQCLQTDYDSKKTQCSPPSSADDLKWMDDMLDDYNKTQCSPPSSADDLNIIDLKLYMVALNQDPPLSEDDYNLLLITMSTN